MNLLLVVKGRRIMAGQHIRIIYKLQSHTSCHMLCLQCTKWWPFAEHRYAIFTPYIRIHMHAMKPDTNMQLYKYNRQHDIHQSTLCFNLIRPHEMFLVFNVCFITLFTLMMRTLAPQRMAHFQGTNRSLHQVLSMIFVQSAT